ncbi:hypothetical protein KI387_001381, partial [Taxus chinensis]
LPDYIIEDNKVKICCICKSSKLPRAVKSRCRQKQLSNKVLRDGKLPSKLTGQMRPFKRRLPGHFCSITFDISPSGARWIDTVLRLAELSVAYFNSRRTT